MTGGRRLVTTQIFFFSACFSLPLPQPSLPLAASCCLSLKGLFRTSMNNLYVSSCGSLCLHGGFFSSFYVGEVLISIQHACALVPVHPGLCHVRTHLCLTVQSPITGHPQLRPDTSPQAPSSRPLTGNVVICLGRSDGVAIPSEDTDCSSAPLSVTSA